MGVFKCDPPPNSDDIRVLRSYIADLYDAVMNVIHNIDEDNLSDEFMSKINISENEVI